MEINSLESLKSAMVASDSNTSDQFGQFRTDLPNFGGSAPADTASVWSWDATRLLVGTCADDLNIVSRDDDK